MRKEIARDTVASRPETKPASSGKGVKRAAPAAGKTIPKKKKKVNEEEATKPNSGQSAQTEKLAKKKKLPKARVVLTKLPPGAQEQTKPKAVKETKKETIPKTVKPKPKKVIVSKPVKKGVKLEHDPKRATKAKIVRAVKDVKKARSLVASKLAKTSTKKSSISEKVGKGVNLVKKHKIMKSVNKMSGKKPCVVSVKISNAHSTVTLSVKQNKQVAKKDNSKNAKPGGEKGSDRSTISIVKKGIASRRKSNSKDGTSQESSPSQSPTRSVSPGKGSNPKPKKSEIVKPQKKIVKESDSKKCVDDKSISCKNVDSKVDNEKTEYIINDSVKIKTENVGEQQNMEIEFTDGSMTDKNIENYSQDESKDNSKRDDSVFEFKAKSPLRDYNLKSIDSCTSDEMPLEILKSKERTKQEKDSTSKKVDSKEGEKVDLDRVKSEDGKKKECASDEKQAGNKKKPDSAKQTKAKVPAKVAKSAKPSDNEKEQKTQDKSKAKLKGLALKQKVAKIVKKSRLTEQKQKKVVDKVDSEESSTGSSTGSDRRMKKLYKFWSGPKRHRVASLNAIAKVHCLYENESRGALNEVISNAAILQRAIEESKKEYAASKEKKKGEEKEKKVVPKRSASEKKPIDVPVSRNLRTNPGVRSVGRNFDILNVISSTSLSSSSSSEESSDSGEGKKQLALLPSVKQKQAQIKKEESDQTSDEEQSQKPTSESNDAAKDGMKKVKKRRRKRNELTMDLKDMVVRKRMASLNASAIMTATYSTEKKIEIKPEKKKIEEPIKKERKKKKKQPVTPPDVDDSSADEDVILRTTNNKQKVAVIVNQDTDVTITGVYVNSTTRSTHHEGYCSIAGMQYRISSTSHTQTEATAVSTETVLHTDHPPCLPEATATTTLATPCKSYTPLNALSSMQPPGQMHHHGHPPGTCPPPRAPSLSPLQRRHGCASAFSAPPNYPQPGPGQHPPPPPHPDVHGNYRWEVDMPCCSVPPPRLCYYQPAGPLISTHHHHHHTTSASLTGKLQPPPLPSPTPPPSSAHPTSHSESSDTEVVLTSASENPPPVRYSYPPHGQPYNPQYYQYYPSPPASSLQYPGQQNHYHQDICYSSPSGYPPGYFPKGHYPPPPGGYPRRYGPPHQYYPPQEYYSNPPPPSGPNPPPPGGNQQQMMVSANPSSGQASNSYPPPTDGNYPTPAPMVDPYPPPPPQPGYYPGYGSGPPPSCYTTHSPSSRGLYLDPAYQGCPCPMQSCPKNVHTGPLTGASKGSLKNHQTTPLPPVALALPLEPPGALGPPSPARGSAGMPPPPSPALATACNPPQWAESPPKLQLEQTGLLTISKMVTDAVMLAEQGETNLAELLPRTEPIKQEIEDIVKIEVIEDAKCNRKRRKSFKSTPVDIKRQSCEPMNESELKVEVQERLTTVKEEPEKTPSPEPETVEKQLPLSDNGATVPVKNSSVAVMTSSIVSKEHPKKRKLGSSDSEVPAKITKCSISTKVAKKNGAKRSKSVTEENIAPECDLVVTAAELVKVECRRSSKPVERRKSLTLHQTPSSVEQTIQHVVEEVMADGKGKKMARSKKLQGKTKADHQLRSHGKPEASAGPIKERRHSKAGSVKSEDSTGKGKKTSALGVAELDPSAESQVCLPGLRRTLAPRWSNGWSWEGTPYKAKIFLNMDDKEVVRKCYPAMRHVQGDVIYPRDSILLKAGPRKIDLPFVAKVAAMWENPDDGEMMVSLLWYYRPEHTEQGRRAEDSPDEIFASRHKDTNSVACIEDKCFVLSFNEYCRYRKTVRRLEEGLGGAPVVVPALEDGGYPRSPFQPPGVVAPELVFFCRRVYDFRQKRILKNPC